MEVLFTAKMLGATNHRGERVKITHLDMGIAKTIPYNYRYNNASDVAHAQIQEWFPELKFVNSEWDGKQFVIEYRLTDES